MTGQPVLQRQVEFVAHVRTRGPMPISEATEYVRLNNMTEPDPYTLTLLWLRAAVQSREVKIYRDGLGVILYASPGLKKLKRYPPLPPVQTDLTRTAPATITESARAAADAAAPLK